MLAIVVTLALPLLVWALGQSVPLPGVSDEVTAMARSRSAVSVFALGLAPIVAAYVLIEVPAAIPRRWAVQRHEDPAFRTRMERGARVATLVIATLQAFGVAKSLEAGLGGAAASLTLLATLVAGVFVLVLDADAISRQGVANGFVVLLAAASLDELVRDVLERLRVGPPSAAGRLLADPTSARAAALLASTAVVVGIVLAVRTRAPSRSPATDDAAHLRLRPVQLPIPAGPAQAYSAAVSLLMLPATLASFHAPIHAAARHLQSPVVFASLSFALALLVSFGLARWFHHPREVARLAERVGFGDEAGVTAALRASERATFAPTALFFLVLVLASATSGIAISALLVLVPAILDVTHGIRLRRDPAQLTPIWSDRRLTAVPLLADALAAHGIRTEVQGRAFVTVFQLGAAFAPMQLLVPVADVPRARSLLALWLGEAAAHAGSGERTSRPEETASDAPKRTTGTILDGTAPAPGTAGAWKRLLPAVALALVALGVSLVPRVGARARSAEPHPTVTFEVTAIDDDADVFSEAPRPAEGSGISIRDEVFGGARRATKTRYVMVSRAGNETREQMTARLEAYVSSLPLPAAARFAYEDVLDYDATPTSSLVGVRAHLLVGAPVLTNADIEDAHVMEEAGAYGGGVYIALTLTREAASRFERFTANWVDRRLAIVLDGVVASAPVVRTAISGGRLSITMGSADDREAQVATAERIASALVRR